MRRRHQFCPEIRGELRTLARKTDNLHGVFAFFCNIIAIIIAIMIAFNWPQFSIFSAIFLGIRARAIATLLHEASHWTLVRNRTLCLILGCLSGWLIFQTFHRYRQSHCLEHHQFLGDEERDPDYLNYSRQGLFDEQPDKFLRKHLWAAVLGQKIWPNLRNLVRDRLACSDFQTMGVGARIEYASFIVFWGFLLVTALWLNATFMLLLWIASYLTVFQTVNWIIELAEHFPIIRKGGSELEMTRNREGHWIEDHICGMHGEKWHLVHHLYPGIPYWHQKAAHHIMMQDPDYALANTSNSGIFTRGSNGATPILARMQAELTACQRPDEACPSKL